MAFAPTPEQVAVCDFIANHKESLLVQAFAGSAKTTTLELAAAKVTGPALALAFNKKIADTLAERLPANFTCKTFNSIGHTAWGKTIGKRIKLDTRKMNRLVQKLEIQNKDLRNEVLALANAAKTCGLVPQGPRHVGVKSFLKDSDEGWEFLAEFTQLCISSVELAQRIDLARQVLHSSIEEAYVGIIDFSDQIYMTACFNGALPRFPTIFVDEAQDLSAIQHYILKKMASGRVVCVGDVNQAIYAWRGAKSDSMHILAEMFKCEVLPLTVCFRCSTSVIKEAQRFTPDMKWPKGAPTGSVINLGPWSFDDIKPDSFILCRNNAPLVSIGFSALQEGRSIKFAGKDIGQRIVRFAELADPSKELPRDKFLEKCEAFAGTFPVKRRPTLQEYIDILTCTPGADFAEIIENLNKLLNADSGNITLSSIHRAKGLEAATVYILDRHLMPSKYATQPEQLQQESNLEYVAITRAQHDLFYIDSNQWKGLRSDA